MDIINEPPSEVPPSLASLGDGNYVVGVKQLKKALRDGRAVQVYLAKNADPKLTGEVTTLCDAGHVPYTWVSTMDDLGKACGISVGAAAAATVKD